MRWHPEEDKVGKKILKSAFCFCLLMAGAAHAEILAGYDFDTGVGDGEDVSTPEANVLGTNLIASDFGTGIGLNACYDFTFAPADGLDAEGNSFGTINKFAFGGTGDDFGFDDVNDTNDLSGAIQDNDYLQFTVTPNAGYKMNLESLTFRTFVQALVNSAERWALFSSVGGYASGSEIATGQTIDVGSWDSASNNHVIELSDAGFQDLDVAVTFRIYVYGGGESTNSITLFDKVVLNGATAKKAILVGYDFDADAADQGAATTVADKLSASQLTSPMGIAFETAMGDNSGVAADGEVFGNTNTFGAVAIGVDDATASSFAEAVAADDYVSFAVTPDDGTGFHLTHLSFKAAKESTGSVDEYAVTDGSGNLIGSAAVITNVVGLTGAYDGVSVDLAGTAYEFIGEATEFRIYAWGRGTNSTANTLAAIDKVALYGEVSNDSGRNSHFWVTLKPQAGTGADTDLVLANGYRSVDLSSPDLACTRLDNGSNWVYQITWTGNNLLDGDAAETLQFNVVVDAFANADYVYVAGDATVTSLGTASTPSDINNHWGVGTDDDLDAGQSIRMTQQDFSVDGVDLEASGLVLENGFTTMKVLETNGGYAHKIIFGVGANLATASFNTPTASYEVGGDSFSVTGAGSNVGSRQWAISEVNFSFVVRNPALTGEDPEYPLADIVPVATPTPYEPTTINKLAQAFPKFSWDRIPRTMLIRKGSASFTDDEARRIANRYDFVVLEKANGNMEGYWDKATALKSYNSDIKVVFYWNSRIYYGNYGVDTSINDHWDEYIDPTYTIRDWPTYQRSNPDLVDWWVGVCHKMMGLVPGVASNGLPFQDFENWEHGSPVDGYFIDKTGVPVSMLQPLYEGSADYNFCMNNNGDNRTRIAYLDGTYREGYTGGGSASAIATAIAIAQESGKNQKLTMLRNPTSGRGSRREMEDVVDATLGYYLAYAEQYAYYYHQQTVDASNADWQWITDYYDQFNRPLGAPLGDAIKDNYIYSRSFEHCDLYLDLDTESGGQLSRILWKNDIGRPALAGSGTSSTDDTYTLQGCGNLSGTADTFFYLSDLHYGNGTVVACMDSLDTIHADARAGIMFRERNEPVTTYSDWAEDYTAAYSNGTILASGARAVAVVRDPAGQMQMVYRSATNGPLQTAGTVGAAYGPYAKLVRSGDTFTGYCSPDGQNWNHIALVTLSMAEKVEMGMAVSSGDAAALATATFSQFSRTETEPKADEQSVTTDEDTPVSITLTGSDAVGSTNLGYSVAAQPVNGTLTGTAPDLTYRPNTNYFGADSFTFTVNDGFADSDATTVSITVAPVNDAPVAESINVSTPTNISVAIALAGSDPDGTTNLTYAVISGPANGELTGTAPDLTYTPSAGYTGMDSFSYTVNDGLIDSVPATVSVYVANVAGAVIAGYDFDDGTGNATTAVTVKDAHVAATGYTTGAGLIELVNQVNGNSNFSNLDAEGNVFGTANGFEFGGALSNFGFTDMNNANNLGLAMDNNDYMTFTVTPANGYKLNLSRFTFRTRVNDQNNSAERWALFSSIGGFANGAEIATGQTTDIASWTNAGNNVAIDLWTEPVLQGLTNAVTFRLYIYGGNANTSSATLFDKVILRGSATLATIPVIDDFGVGVVPGGASMVLSWQAQSGTSYGVMATTNLVTGTWSNIVEGIVGFDGVVSVTNTPAVDQQYYRAYIEE
jgi:hypothetical protein